MIICTFWVKNSDDMSKKKKIFFPCMSYHPSPHLQLAPLGFNYAKRNSGPFEAFSRIPGFRNKDNIEFVLIEGFIYYIVQD